MQLYQETPGEVLVKHMARKGFSQSKLASKLGLHPTTINKITKDDRMPSIEVFADVAGELGGLFVMEYIDAVSHSDR